MTTPTIEGAASMTNPAPLTKGELDTVPHGTVVRSADGTIACAAIQLQTTQDWRDWTSNSGKMLPQNEFAEFVEQHLPNFLRPSAADMLELAQTIKGHTKVNFESSKRVKSGETAIEWREETTAAAGKKGTLEIPDTIDLGMQVYEGGAPYRLVARFRYRIGGGQLALGYVLERADDVHRDAFGHVVQHVAADAEREVWHGTP